MYHSNINLWKVRTAVLKSDKVDFRAKTITSDNKGHFTRLVKGPINQEDITILNI